MKDLNKLLKLPKNTLMDLMCDSFENFVEILDDIIEKTDIDVDINKNIAYLIILMLFSDKRIDNDEHKILGAICDRIGIGLELSLNQLQEFAESLNNYNQTENKILNTFISLARSFPTIIEPLLKGVLAIFAYNGKIDSGEIKMYNEFIKKIISIAEEKDLYVWSYFDNLDVDGLSSKVDNNKLKAKTDVPKGYMIANSNNGLIKKNAYYMSKLTHIYIPEGVTIIGENAFGECKSLEDVILPSTLNIIEQYGFAACLRLNKIIIPKSVTVIKDLAFWGNVNLTIYCETDKKPKGYASRWNEGLLGKKLDVVWNYNSVIIDNSKDNSIHKNKKQIIKSQEILLYKQLIQNILNKNLDTIEKALNEHDYNNLINKSLFNGLSMVSVLQLLLPSMSPNKDLVKSAYNYNEFIRLLDMLLDSGWNINSTRPDGPDLIFLDAIALFYCQNQDEYSLVENLFYYLIDHGATAKAVHPFFRDIEFYLLNLTDYKNKKKMYDYLKKTGRKT